MKSGFVLEQMAPFVLGKPRLMRAAGENQSPRGLLQVPVSAYLGQGAGLRGWGGVAPWLWGFPEIRKGSVVSGFKGRKFTAAGQRPLPSTRNRLLSFMPGALWVQASLQQAISRAFHSSIAGPKNRSRSRSQMQVAKHLFAWLVRVTASWLAV